MGMLHRGERVLVVGGGGFIGGAIIPQLLAQGRHVTVLGRNEIARKMPHVEWVRGDLEDFETVSPLLAAKPSVIYLAGNSRPGSGPSSIVKEIQEEVAAFAGFAERCAESGVCSFVFASSGGTVYGNPLGERSVESDADRPQSFYGCSKLMNEHVLRMLSLKHEMTSVTLRVSNPYGPGQYVRKSQGFIAAVMNALFNRDILRIWGDGSVARDFVYISDTARAFVDALSLTSGFHLFNIASGRGTSLLEICEMVESISGRSLNTVFERERSVDVPRSVLCNDLAGHVLGWHPETSLQEGVRATLEWWEEASRHYGTSNV
jgi:UDP-glucose 4-epimerase